MSNNEEAKIILEELAKCMSEFEELEKIKKAHEQNKISLSLKQLQELENKYKILYEKMKNLNLKAKKI